MKGKHEKSRNAGQSGQTKANLGQQEAKHERASDEQLSHMGAGHSGITDVKTKTAEALRAAEADPRASVVLIAVVREFDKKADKAIGQTSTPSAVREAVVELEQAGDSAKAAAEADPGIDEPTRKAVLDAHLAICL